MTRKHGSGIRPAPRIGAPSTVRTDDGRRTDHGAQPSSSPQCRTEPCRFRKPMRDRNARAAAHRRRQIMETVIKTQRSRCRTTLQRKRPTKTKSHEFASPVLETRCKSAPGTVIETQARHNQHLFQGMEIQTRRPDRARTVVERVPVQTVRTSKSAVVESVPANRADASDRKVVRKVPVVETRYATKKSSRRCRSKSAGSSRASHAARAGRRAEVDRRGPWSARATLTSRTIYEEHEAPARKERGAAGTRRRNPAPWPPSAGAPARIQRSQWLIAAFGRRPAPGRSARVRSRRRRIVRS